MDGFGPVFGQHVARTRARGVSGLYGRVKKTALPGREVSSLFALPRVWGEVVDRQVAEFVAVRSRGLGRRENGRSESEGDLVKSLWDALTKSSAANTLKRSSLCDLPSGV